jgi:uncharacterized protein YjbI with pentapeptide repeats
MSTAQKPALSPPDEAVGHHDSPASPLRQSPDTHNSAQSNFALTAWFQNVASELRSPKGWKLSCEIAGGIILVWTAVLGVMTYHSAHLIDLKDGAERSYYQLVGDLAHSSSQVRIGATFRVPQVMLRRVPLKDSLGPIDSLMLTMGGKLDTFAPYHPNVQQIFRLHLANLNSRNSDWSLAEVQAAIEVLRNLGPEGWYDARETDHTTIPQTKALAWLWQNQRPPLRSYESASTLFEGVRLDGINFQGFELTNADFQRASMKGAILQYAHLAGSNLQSTDLERADISTADLKFSQLVRANLAGAYMMSASVDSANFKNATLHGAFLQQIECPSCNFLEANLDGASLWKANLRNAYVQNASLVRTTVQGANLTNADMSSATLSFADFDGAVLDSADLSYAIATKTKFRNASLRNADLRLADLRGADFTGSKDLQSVRDWTDANIANALGLTGSIRSNAISKGAVELPKDIQWRAYKQAGRPKGRWRQFLTMNQK